jgi:predicted ester cyclase
MDDAEAVIRRYYELFNQRHLDAGAELVAPNATFLHRPTTQRQVGRAGYRTFAEAWIAAFPDARVEVLAVAAEPDGRFRADIVGRGTHEGFLDLGDMRLPPIGRRAQLPFRQYFTIRDGLIAEAELDFDRDQMRRLLTPRWT